MKKALLTLLAAVLIPIVFFVSLFLISFILTILSKIPIIGQLVTRFLVGKDSSAGWFSFVFSIFACVYATSFFEKSTKMENGIIAGFISSGITMFAVGVILTVSGILGSQSFFSILIYFLIAAYGVYSIITGARGS